MSSQFCEHGNLRRTCVQCRSEAVRVAEERAASNRARGESREQEWMERPTLTFPWQNQAFDAWKSGGRSGLVALSPGLPLGDLPYAVVADLLQANRSTNVLIATAAGEADRVHAELEHRFGLAPTRLIDHHFLEPRDEGSLVVADLEELRTVDLASWGRFASTGLFVLLDADGVGPQLGQVLLQAPFSSRFCVSRQPSAMDLLVSRPWAPGFGPLQYRMMEAEARDMGILPRIRYRLHVEMLRPEGRDRGAEGPWDPTDVPTRVPPVAATPFVRGKARDVAIRRAKDDPKLLVLHEGAPVREADVTVPLGDLPSTYETPPTGWLLADPSAGVRDLLRIATTAYKATGEAGHVEDVVVLPVPADLCRAPPWDERWRSTARQLDRVAVALLLAEDPGAVMPPEDLETLVGVALALRGIPADDLHRVGPVVAEAAEAAQAGRRIAPEQVRAAGRAYGGLAAALLVAAQTGPADLLRLAHPGFTPTVPDLPHPALYDARRHGWRGRAFKALADAARGGDVVTAWGRYPELRFVFPSSLLLEVATAYCRRHRVKGPLDDQDLKPVRDHTTIADGDRDQAAATLKEWADALRLAEKHERDYLSDMHARQPERERRREGVALPSLTVKHRDRDHITFESKSGRFPATNISPGCEVSIVGQGDRKELGRGLVSKIGTRQVTVECPDGPPDRLPKHVTVNLTFDAKVFEAYESALGGAQRALGSKEAVDDGPDGLLRTALLGETPGKDEPQRLELPGLTESQQEAIDAVLSGGRVRLVHGPPGTGKTHTLTHLAMALTRAGHSVLVTADSNAAVDNLVVGLRRNGALVVRVAHAPNLRDPAAEACRIDPMEAPPFVRWAAEQGIVVATTNYGAFRYLDRPGSMSPFLFDYVVHDEAGQSTAPSSLAAVMRGRRLVLAGDPLQLPPTVVSMDAKEAGLDVTLFERIEALTGKDRTRMLRTQFRSVESIMAFSNRRFYDGLIETAPSAADQETLPDLPPSSFLHVTGKENPRQRNGSISNDFEVEAVVAAVDRLRTTLQEKGWTLAVLTPYQAQRERLRRRLGDVEVSTVDGAQGREWDVVLYSAVRSNPQHRLGFLSDERRLNVAATRAKRNFLLIGDERTLSDNEAFHQLLAETQKVRIEYPRPEQTQARGRGVPKGPKRRRRRSGRHGKGPQGGPKGRSDGDGGRRSGKNGRRGRGGRRPPKDGGRPDKPSKDPAAPSGPAEAKGDSSQDSPRDASRGGSRGDPHDGPRDGPAPKPPQCSATTHSGSRCRNRAASGSDRCRRHQ